jgi:hypothetical protein
VEAVLSAGMSEESDRDPDMLADVPVCSRAELVELAVAADLLGSGASDDGLYPGTVGTVEAKPVNEAVEGVLSVERPVEIDDMVKPPALAESGVEVGV